MMYAFNLVPASLPSWLELDGVLYEPPALTPEQLAAQGWLPLIYEPEDAPLGYADPVAETREGQQVAVAYALGTPEERAAVSLASAKTAAHEARSAERLRLQTSGFPFADHVFASDREESIPLLSAATLSALMVMGQGAEAIAAFEAALGAGWRDVTGVACVSSAAGILGMHAAFVGWGSACDRASQALAAQIEAAETLAALNAIDLTAGWPSLSL
jgi:hypothetical protein